MGDSTRQRVLARWMGRLCLAAAALGSLAGCGGGGGGDKDDDNPASPTYAVGGTLSGLSGSVTLRNGSETLTRSANGAFTFSGELEEGDSYSVSVATQPSGQTCSVANGSGTVGKADVSNVSVTCTSTGGPTTYSIGGTVSGLAGSVTLANGITLTEIVTVTANGSFTFPTRVVNGSAYAVMVTTQPSGQTCSVVNGSGSVASASVTNISVACATTTASTDTRSWTAGVALEPTDDSVNVDSDIPDAGMADDGRVVASFTKTVGSRKTLYVVHGTPGASGAAPTWSELQSLDDAAPLKAGTSHQSIAVSPNGNAVAAWITSGTCNGSTYSPQVGRAGGCNRLVARRYLASSGTWEDPVTVIDTPGDTTNPLIARINDQGDVVIGYVGWIRSGTTGWNERAAVAWRAGGASGTYKFQTFDDWGLGSSTLFPPVFVQDIDVGLTQAGGIVLAGLKRQTPSSSSSPRDVVAFRGNVADVALAGGVVDTRPDGASDFRMKVGQQGQTLLQWTQNDGSRTDALYVATAESSTAAWTVRSLGESAANEDERPALVVTDAGTAYLFRSCLFKSWSQASGWSADWTAMPELCGRTNSQLAHARDGSFLVASGGYIHDGRWATYDMASQRMLKNYSTAAAAPADYVFGVAGMSGVFNDGVNNFGKSKLLLSPTGVGVFIARIGYDRLPTPSEPTGSTRNIAHLWGLYFKK